MLNEFNFEDDDATAFAEMVAQMMDPLAIYSHDVMIRTPNGTLLVVSNPDEDQQYRYLCATLH